MQATWRQFFFSPRGRFTRSQYWGATLSIYGALFLLALPFIITYSNESQNYTPNATSDVYYIVLFVVFIAVTISHFFAIIKRFHDRNKPWPWCFIVFAPYLGGLWILVECGCLEGTPGPNDYGP